jgi:hypothetical protein
MELWEFFFIFDTQPKANLPSQNHQTLMIRIVVE